MLKQRHASLESNLLCTFKCENDHFAKTGSGQQQLGKVEGKGGGVL
jgi:hypothetical protein